MATPFSDVYSVFFRKVTDYSFFNISEVELNDVLESYLDGAIVKFKKCNKDLKNRNKVTSTFVESLDEEELEILGCLMVIEWLTPVINDTKLLKQVITDKDFKIYSQSQHLKEITIVRDGLKKEVNQIISDYTYNSLKDWEQ